MKNAKELMLDYTAFSFRDPKKAAEMFAEDGAFELPYLATFGLPTQYSGRDAIAGFFQSVLDIYPGFKFENIKVLIDTPDQAFAEFEATAVSSKTGRSVHQLFFARLVAENGKIKLFREALNTVEVARANVQDSAGLFLRKRRSIRSALCHHRQIVRCPLKLANCRSLKRRIQKPNVIHMGDTFFNGSYPVIDASTGGKIDGMIVAAGKVLPLAENNTKIVPGHGPLGNKADVTKYRDMLVVARDRVQKLKTAGKSADEIAASKPLADLDPVWGHGMLSSDMFVQMIYSAL